MVLPSVKLAMLNPVVDHTFSDSEAGCNVGNRDLSRNERGRYLYPVDMAKPSVLPLRRTVVQFRC